MRMKLKMQVASVSSANGTDTVTLTALAGSARENTFAKGAPSSSLTLAVDHPSAQGWLARGKKVILDLVDTPN